jgi:hypothetical protein
VSTPEQDAARLHQVAMDTLNADNCATADLAAHAATMTPHMRLIDGEVRVVDAQGKVRERFDNRPLSVAELLGELKYYKRIRYPYT